MLLINICGRLLLLVVALVAAAPSPRQLEIREPAAAQPPQCSPSLALVLVRALKASQFCTSYLHLTTKTVSKTATSVTTSRITVSTTKTVVQPSTTTTTKPPTQTIYSTVPVQGSPTTTTAIRCVSLVPKS